MRFTQGIGLADTLEMLDLSPCFAQVPVSILEGQQGILEG